MKKPKSLLFLAVISLLIFSCNWLADKKVNCQAIGYILFENRFQFDVRVEMTRNSDTKSSMIEKFSQDTFFIKANETYEDTVKYDWEGTTYCSMFCTNDYGMSSFLATVFQGDTILSKYILYPCDSTKQHTLDTCENCIVEFYDTLFIE